MKNNEYFFIRYKSRNKVRTYNLRGEDAYKNDNVPITMCKLLLVYSLFTLSWYCGRWMHDCRTCTVMYCPGCSCESNIILETSPLDIISDQILGLLLLILIKVFVIISFIDHFNRHTWIYFFKLKSDTLNAFVTRGN